MAWIEVTYLPGFQEDLTSWKTEIELDGHLSQIVDVARYSPVEKRTERYLSMLSAEQIAELGRLIEKVDFRAVDLASKNCGVDDLERISVCVREGSKLDSFSAPLQWWEFNRQKEDNVLPEISGAIVLWKAIDEISPFRAR